MHAPYGACLMLAHISHVRVFVRIDMLPMQCMNSGSHCSAIRGVEWVYRVDQAVLRRTPLATGAMATTPKKRKQNIANQLYM
jgi:hypothetical protein